MSAFLLPNNFIASLLSVGWKRAWSWFLRKLCFPVSTALRGVGPGSSFGVPYRLTSSPPKCTFPILPEWNTQKYTFGMGRISGLAELAGDKLRGKNRMKRLRRRAPGSESVPRLSPGVFIARNVKRADDSRTSYVPDRFPHSRPL